MSSARAPHPVTRSTSSSVLIVRLGALGDVVHAMPVVAALREAWPTADVGWLVQAPYADLVRRLDGVSQVHAVRGRLDTQALRQVRHARYDVCLDLQGLLKSALWARASGAHRVIGFSRAVAREPLASALYGETGGVASGHVIDRNLSLLPRLGIVTQGRPRVRLSVPASTSADSARTLLGGREVPFALLNAGAGWPNKRWPATRFGELADRLLDAHGLRSLVVWGPGEASLAAAVVRASKRSAAVMAPESNILDVLALASVAQVVVAGDTGPLHLAAAVEAPLVGLYGPTPPDRNGPWAPDDLCVSRHDRCACVFKRRCTADIWCLGEVTVEDVALAVSRRLAVRTGDAPPQDARGVPPA